MTSRINYTIFKLFLCSKLLSVEVFVDTIKLE